MIMIMPMAAVVAHAFVLLGVDVRAVVVILHGHAPWLGSVGSSTSDQTR